MQNDKVEATLVIIRGNSGSGKSSLAQALKKYYGRRTLLVSQDMVRREILRERMVPNNLSVALSEELIRFGYENKLLVIVEGFYETEVYGQMLAKMRDLFSPRGLYYYYNLSFEETARRHQLRPKKDEFTVCDMRRWWREKDYLGWEGEETLGVNSLEYHLQKIIKAIEDLDYQ